MSYIRKKAFRTKGSDRGFKSTARYTPTTSRGQARLSAARAVTRTSQLNRRAVANKETGFVDLALASYPYDTTGSVTLIATVAQGASVNQRIGKKAMWKSIQVRGQSFNGTTATINDVAWLIVYDKRPTGSLPAVTDILVSASAAAFNNDANSGRFRIIKRVDQLIAGNNAAAANQLENMAVSEDCFVDLKGIPVVYKAAGTGAIGDIEEGALYLVTVGSAAAGTAAATASLAFRTRFVDM